MKVAFVAIDAKYIHTNLAVRYLRNALKQNKKIESSIAEFTINHKRSDVLEELYTLGADIYLFSCYIWNVEFVCAVAKELKKLMPKSIFVVGGPQVSYNAEEFLENNPAFCAVLVGEGETSLPLFITALLNKSDWQHCPSLVYKHGGKVVRTKVTAPIHMDDIPFAYSDKDLQSGRILYYETMRGCPFSCSYCLSSIEKGVRYKSFEKIEQELDIFLKAGIKQIKFVDRTFNCNKKHAMRIWEFLAKKDNGSTNFHFELAAELLDDEMIAFLQKVREGLFQLEIGVQSTNTATLEEIQRPADLEKLFRVVKQLQKNKNIHLHLDLIAGLPCEDFESFEKSFNDVYAMRPAQLQLGMLKMLDGSAMRQKTAEYGILYNDASPFEVLRTRWIEYDKLRLLGKMANMVELYYNSGRFDNIIEHIGASFEGYFKFYKALAEHHTEKGFNFAALSKIGAYDLLGSLAHKVGFALDEKAQWLCRLDILFHEKAKNMPSWVGVENTKTYYNRVLAFYSDSSNIEKYLPDYKGLNPKQVSKMAHIEVFPFNILSGEPQEYALLFNYKNKDIFKKAMVFEIKLPAD